MDLALYFPKSVYERSSSDNAVGNRRSDFLRDVAAKSAETERTVNRLQACEAVAMAFGAGCTALALNPVSTWTKLTSALCDYLLCYFDADPGIRKIAEPFLEENRNGDEPLWIEAADLALVKRYEDDDWTGSYGTHHTYGAELTKLEVSRDPISSVEVTMSRLPDVFEGVSIHHEVIRNYQGEQCGIAQRQYECLNAETSFYNFDFTAVPWQVAMMVLAGTSFCLVYVIDKARRVAKQNLVDLSAQQSAVIASQSAASTQAQKVEQKNKAALELLNTVSRNLQSLAKEDKKLFKQFFCTEFGVGADTVVWPNGLQGKKTRAALCNALAMMLCLAHGSEALKECLGGFKAKSGVKLTSAFFDFGDGERYPEATSYRDCILHHLGNRKFIKASVKRSVVCADADQSFMQDWKEQYELVQSNARVQEILRGIQSGPGF